MHCVFFQKLWTIVESHYFQKHHFVIIIGDINSSGPLTLRMRDFLSSFNWKLSINLLKQVTATASTVMDNVI